MPDTTSAQAASAAPSARAGNALPDGAARSALPLIADGRPLANGAAGPGLDILGVAPHVAKAVREELDLWAAHLMRLVARRGQQRGAA